MVQENELKWKAHAGPQQARRKLGRGRLRVAVVLAAALLPHSRFKRVLLERLGDWTIHPTARLGSIIAFNIHGVTIGPGAYLRSFSVYRNLDSLVVGKNAVIGHWNWIIAGDLLRRVPPTGATEPRASLILGEHGGITSRHYLDCSGGVNIGAFSILAGVRSTVLTHQVDLGASRQQISSVTIGSYCFIGSNVCIVPGVQIVERCAVGMGAVVVSSLEASGMLYGGVPARALKSIENAEFFLRDSGFVSLPVEPR